MNPKLKNWGKLYIHNISTKYAMGKVESLLTFIFMMILIGDKLENLDNLGDCWTKLREEKQGTFLCFWLKKEMINSASYILNSDFYSLIYYFLFDM